MVSLSLDPPPARPGRQPSRNPRRLGLLLALAVVGAAGFLTGRWTAPGGRFGVTASRGAPSAPARTDPGSAAPAPAEPAAPALAAVPAPGTPPAPIGAALGTPGEAPAPAAPAPAAAPAAPAAAGPRRIATALSGPLEEAITAAMPPADRGMAEQLTQVVNRLLVWELQVARDGRRGDRVEILYSPPGEAAPGLAPSAEPVVEAVRFASQKLGRTFAAYRFQPSGARWARYYRSDASELELRLVDAPLPDYDQVTSLLRDGRRHKGVDFRTPAGTPVFATFDGVIERRNWNFAGNGNCLDVRDLASGRHAIFLHLEVLPKEMAVGRTVHKGERIALSGNSGHSFAPHLHYQLESPEGQILDPFEVQPTRRVALDAGQRTGFEEQRARLDAALSGQALAPAAPAPEVPSLSAVPAAR